MVGFLDFIHDLKWSDVPAEARTYAKRCLIDTLGVGISASRTDTARQIRDHAADHFAAGASAAALIGDSRRVSPTGAALANGMIIDAIDAHDGHNGCKGHVGCHTIPAMLAITDSIGGVSGEDLLTAVVVGYEIGSRMGQALHASVPDYHTSGAWGAVACAALGARLLKLGRGQTRHAIGIGEFHGPRSQMMRLIDHPSQLKDGSGWGAMAGVSAAFLAKSGFTGAPAISVEGDEVASLYNDLGSRWLILEQYFKPYPVCRWAQPAVEAAVALADEHTIAHEQIERIEVFTFHEGCRLATRHPKDSSGAQYSLPFPVAATLVRGQLTPAEIDGEALTDPAILNLSDRVKLHEVAEYNEAFPAMRYAHVAVVTKDGRRMESARHTARGDAQHPLTHQEIETKFHAFTDPIIGVEEGRAFRATIDGLAHGGTSTDLTSFLGRGW